jgi:hypothetical protein
MVNRVGMLSLIKQTWKTFASAPGAIALCSIPAVVGDTANDFISTEDWQNQWAMAAYLFVVTCCAGFFYEWSNASLFLWIERLAKGEPARAADSLKTGLKTSIRWYPAVLLALLLIFIGTPLVLPTLYFMTVFAFSTPAAISFPQGKPLSALVYSRSLVSWRIFPWVCLLIVFEVGLEFGLNESLSRYLSHAVPTVWLEFSVKIASVFYHSWVCVFLALLFLKLRRDREQIHLRNSGTSGAEKPSMG